MTDVSRASAATSRAAIAHHSRSFALAARLLPSAVRDRASVVYAWCRRADDAVDTPGADANAAVARLERELARIYAGERFRDPVVDGFAGVVRAAAIPRRYPAELLAGLAMDARGHRFQHVGDLRLYCYRVAGVVGLMMCHVTGLAEPGALVAAARLGIAMQLTNICRDVREDWSLGRLYIPRTVLDESGAGWLAGPRVPLQAPLPLAARGPLARAIARLLAHARRDYHAGDTGMVALPPSCRLAIATARRIYAGIGDELERAGCDPFAPRAVVPAPRKLLLASIAAATTARDCLRAPRVREYRHDLPELGFEAIA